MNSLTVCSNRYPSIVEKTKRLLMRGPAAVNGIRSLSRAFGISNDCGGGVTVSRDAFVRALEENQVDLTKEEVDMIFMFLDRAATGAVDPAEFIAGLRHESSPLRRSWLHRVWDIFTKNQEGAASVDELQQLFRAEKHPDVVRGKRSVGDVSEEFHATFNEATNPDGVVSHQEFCEYYSGVSSACFNDEEFVSLLRCVWPIPGVCEPFSMSLAVGEVDINKTHSAYQTLAEKKTVTASRKTEGEMMRIITDEHRPQVMVSGLATRLLATALRTAEVGSTTGFLSVEQFLEAIQSRRLYIPQVDALQFLDTNGDGSVDTTYYLALLLPALPSTRSLMLERMWQLVFSFKDKRNRVDVKEIQSKFIPKDSQEKSDFLSAWDVRTALGAKVGLVELMEWYVPQSKATQLDKEFEALLVRQWKGLKELWVTV